MAFGPDRTISVYAVVITADALARLGSLSGGDLLVSSDLSILRPSQWMALGGRTEALGERIGLIFI